MKVLITGFAGTVGQEFTKQLLEQGHEVVGVDNNEWAVATVEKQPRLTIKLMDFAHVKGRFDLIIHCAAYKHVDLIEQNKVEAYDNDVIKTQQLYDNVKGKILFISTDKAVEPASFYGTIKQIGEDLTQEYGGIIARMGNIMASNGSVIPKWEKCIDDGTPLPITDPEMTRYMIPVEKAVKSILGLLGKAKTGQVIVPEMGEPIGLLELANKVADKYEERHPDEFIDRSDNVFYKVVGIRPGEKMHEKLIWDYEQIIYKNDLGMIVEGR